MNIACVWEHNGNDTLLYAANFPGAYTRGASLQEAMEKMPAEIRSYLNWKGADLPENVQMTVVQDAACSLNIADADSDVLFFSEKASLPREEYVVLKNLALKSAADFLAISGHSRSNGQHRAHTNHVLRAGTQNGGGDVSAYQKRECVLLWRDWGGCRQ